MWTADHTCGRCEAVDENGEQPEEQPNRLETNDGGRRDPEPCRRGRGGDREKKEMGANSDGENRKQHTARRLSLRKRNNPNSSSSNRSDAFAVTHANISATLHCGRHRDGGQRDPCITSATVELLWFYPFRTLAAREHARATHPRRVIPQSWTACVPQ